MPWLEHLAVLRWVWGGRDEHSVEVFRGRLGGIAPEDMSGWNLVAPITRLSEARPEVLGSS